MIRDRSFTYHGQIKVSREDMRLAKVGRKTCTIRLGTAQVADAEIDLTDGRERVRIRIAEVETNRPYADITELEARADGAESLEALDKDLRRFYGPLDPAQPMTLIHFSLASPTLSSDQVQLWE
jgi:hypothetical protein